jgi:hypothetical protein
MTLQYQLAITKKIWFSLFELISNYNNFYYILMEKWKNYTKQDKWDKEDKQYKKEGLGKKDK